MVGARMRAPARTQCWVNAEPVPLASLAQSRFRGLQGRRPLETGGGLGFFGWQSCARSSELNAARARGPLYLSTASGLLLRQGGDDSEGASRPSELGRCLI